MKESNPFHQENDREVVSGKKKVRRKHLGSAALERKPIDRARAPEARQLHGEAEPNASEHIGHVLLAAEASARRAQKPEQRRDPAAEKRINTLSRTELLSLSEKIIVDGTSLRQIYESHLIGERGLRRLMTEHVRGGDLKKALRREILEREIDFERDPALRDMTSDAQSTAATTEVSSEALNKLLEKVTIAGRDEGEEAAFYKARAEYEVQQLQQQHKKSRVVDLTITITISFLVMVIIILYLMRG